MQNSMLMMCHYPNLGNACDWLCRKGNLLQSIKSTTQIWVVVCHQYEISVVVAQMSFREETSDGVAKFGLFSQASFFANVALQDKQVKNAYSRHTTCLTNYAAKILVTLQFLLQLDWRSLGHNHASWSCAWSVETSHAMSRNTTRDRKGAP